MFGIFTLAAFALVLLAVDCYTVSGTLRRVCGWVAGVGLIVATLGSSLWAFIDPSTGGLAYWIYIFGVLVMGVSALVATNAVYAAKVKRISRLET
jgi:quinol-cytochrome oxidoreductase complex cytochrome b subunit